MEWPGKESGRVKGVAGLTREKQMRVMPWFSIKIIRRSRAARLIPIAEAAALYPSVIIFRMSAAAHRATRPCLQCSLAQEGNTSSREEFDHEK